MPVQDGIVGPVPPGRQPDDYDRQRRRVLWSMPAGLYVLGSRRGDRRNLMTCNWVSQVATSPKLVATAVEREAVTAGLIVEGGSFSVSFLAREDRAVARKFVKPVEEVAVGDDGAVTAMQGIEVFELADGVPVVASSVGWLACALRHTLELGSHTLFVGEVTDVGGRATGPDDDPQVLRMEDTRMNYGG
ncbi:MAG: flavin reductase family protein [Acidimicrobiales bacterium]|jgi:flavin reductase (DIM6/NTAB) family NADH-FMN oxidoreductase RutF